LRRVFGGARNNIRGAKKGRGNSLGTVFRSGGVGGWPAKKGDGGKKRNCQGKGGCVTVGGGAKLKKSVLGYDFGGGKNKRTGKCRSKKKADGDRAAMHGKTHELQSTKTGRGRRKGRSHQMQHMRES